MRKITGFLFFTLITLQSALAHVGSPSVIMEGNAGPYKLLVTIVPPDVIPGIAKVGVFLQNGGAGSVSFRTIDFITGDEGAPSADPMNAVKGQPGQYSGNVWLMTPSPSGIQITVEGKGGKGAMVVPVVAVSTAEKRMPSSTTAVLLILGLFLFVLMVTIAGASVSSALVKAGEALSARRQKMRSLGAGIAAVLFSLLLYGGGRWWQSSADKYRKYMFQPLQASSKITQADGKNELILSLDTASVRRQYFSYLLPDHGKLMHLFLLRFPALDAFAHLHPVRMDSATFKTTLPKLPKGNYLIFADIVYNSGFTETVRDTLTVSADLAGSPPLDNDDASAFASPADLLDGWTNQGVANAILCGKSGTGVKLSDGSTMVWESAPDTVFQTGKLYPLTFGVLTPQNQPLALDPYMGMQGHAVVVRTDGNVYVHLHPVGNYSMAAEASMLNRIADPQGVYHFPSAGAFRDSVDGYLRYLKGLDEKSREELLMAQMSMPAAGPGGMNMDHTNTVTFPYAFPQPGKYRIWVQVKRAGRVLTGAFDAVVK